MQFFMCYETSSEHQMDIIKFYGSPYRDNTHFMETERVINQLEYQLGLYIMFCISKAEAEFPVQSHQTAQIGRNTTEYIYNNCTIEKHAILALSEKQQLHCSTSCCQLQREARQGILRRIIIPVQRIIPYYLRNSVHASK